MSPLPAPGPARLSALSATFLTLLTLVIGLGVVHGMAGAWALATGTSYGLSLSRITQEVRLTSLAQAFAMGSVLKLGLRMATDPGGARQALSLGPCPPAALAVFFLAGLCLQLPLSELANLLHAHVFEPRSLEEQEALQRMLAPDDPLARAGVFLCLAAVVPAAEELLFRGLIQTGLCRTQGRAGAVLLSAALFAVCHVQPVPVAYAFVAGLALGVVALRTGSVFATIALHAGVNALPVILAGKTWSVDGLTTPAVSVTHLPPAASLGGLAGAAALVWLGVRVHGRSRV